MDQIKTLPEQLTITTAYVALVSSTILVVGIVLKYQVPILSETERLIIATGAGALMNFIASIVYRLFRIWWKKYNIPDDY